MRWPVIAAAVVLAAVVGVGAAGYYMINAEPIPGFVEIDADYLLDDARHDPEAVQTVQLSTAGQKLTFRRDGDLWRMQERDGYPTYSAAVDDLIRSVLDLKVRYVSEESHPDYSALGVDRDLESATATPIRVALLGAGGETITRLIVGGTNRAPDGSQADMAYVRREGDARVWIADRALRISPDIDDWLQREIVDVERSRVAQLVLRQDGGESLSIVRREAGNLDIEAGSVAKEELDGPWVLEGLAASLEEVRFEDVVPASANVDTGESRGTTRLDVRTVDDVEYSVRLSQNETGVWGQFSARRAASPATAERGAAGGNADAAVEAFNRRHDGWIYRLPEYMAKVLTTSPVDFGTATK